MTQTHAFHILRVDFDATERAKENLDFEEEMQVIASIDENGIAQKLTGLEPELATREIYRESQKENPSVKFELTDSVFHSRSQKKRQFFVYMLSVNSGGHGIAKVFSLSVLLGEETKSGCSFIENVKKLRLIEGVSDFKSFKFFSKQNEVAERIFWQKKLLTRAEEIESAKDAALKGLVPEATVPNSETAKQAHFRYVQRKIFRRLFRLAIGKDAILMFVNGESLILVFEDFLVAQFRLWQLTNDACYSEIFEIVSPIKVRKQVLQMKVRVPSTDRPIDIFYTLPTFQDDVTVLLIEVLKEGFSKHFFWAFVKDFLTLVISRHERLKNSEFGSELELLVAYFSSLLMSRSIRGWLEEKKQRDIDDRLIIQESKVSSGFIQLSKNEPFNKLSRNGSGDNAFYLLLRNQMTKYQINHSAENIGVQGEQANPANKRQPAKVRPLKIEEKQEHLLNQTAAISSANKSFWQSKMRDFISQINANSADYEDIKVRFFKTIHLLNEDLRLSRDSGSLYVKLSYFLYTYATFLNVPFADAHRSYYANICPQIVLMFGQSEYLLNLQSLLKQQQQQQPTVDPIPSTHPGFSDYLEPKVFDLVNFIHQIFQSQITVSQINETISKNPYIFRNYYRLIKVIFLLYNRKLDCSYFQAETEDTHNLPTGDPSTLRRVYLLRDFRKLANQLAFQATLNQKVVKELQLAKNKKRNFDRIFIFFLRQKISFNYIESLADFATYFYKTILRLLRKEISKFLIEGSLPKSAYKLLMREDLYANKFLQPIQKFSSVRTINFSTQHGFEKRQGRGAEFQPVGFANVQPSDVSLQAHIPNTNLMEVTSNQLSTMLLHFNDGERSQNDVSFQRPPTRQFNCTQNLGCPITATQGALQFTGNPSAQSLDQFAYSSSNPVITLNQNSSTNTAEETQSELIGRLERELNITGYNYSRNLHFSKSETPFLEVYRLFNCSEIMIVNKRNYEKIQNYEEFTEEKLFTALNSAIYAQLCQRLSSSIGKGAIDLGTEHVSVTDYIAIPAINTNGRIKEKERNFSYVFNMENYSDTSAMNWAEFHNGVAAALSISKKSLAKIDKEGLRTWIEYQKTDFTRYDHAGLVYGLGLQGVLDCFTISDIYFNLKGGIDARIIGTVLGLAIFKNDNLHCMIEETKQKTFCLLLEINMSEKSNVQISRIVQAAGMIGNGIYNKESCKKGLLETMLREIQAPPVNDNNNNRECHSLAAGFALGLINLGKGSNVSSTKNLHLDDNLFKLVVDASKGSIFDKNREQQLPNQGSPNSGTFPHRDTCYRASNIKEPVEGNGLLTTPSALIALTLIHLKTNNAIVARRLELPNTIYEINNGNALHILLKSLARHLIMWRDIDTTEEFLLDSIPPTVRSLQENSIFELAQTYINNQSFEKMDFHNLTVIYFNIIAGTLTAIAMKNAGTGDESIKSLIIKYIKKVRDLSILSDEFAMNFSYKNKIDAHSYFNILAILSLALGILMAGRCDTESEAVVYSLLKRLKRYENEPDCVQLNSIYGFFMAFQMAIGFLFLGNGALSFGTENFQIACLLMSIYPVFPENFNDNKYHLQALRHFYVLASEEK